MAHDNADDDGNVVVDDDDDVGDDVDQWKWRTVCRRRRCIIKSFCENGHFMSISQTYLIHVLYMK